MTELVVLIIASVTLFFVIVGGIFWALSFIADAVAFDYGGFSDDVTGSGKAEWPPR